MEVDERLEKIRLLKKAILELPTDKYDYVISVLEEKWQQLESAEENGNALLADMDTEIIAAALMEKLGVLKKFNEGYTEFVGLVGTVEIRFKKDAIRILPLEGKQMNEMRIIEAEIVADIESKDPKRMTNAKKLADDFFQITGKDLTYSNGDVRFSIKDMIIPTNRTTPRANEGADPLGG